MFSRVNSLGWALFEELTSSQMNQLDLNVSRALDGVFGGTYNLSNTLTINGTVRISNMEFTGGTITTLGVTGTLTADTISVTTMLDSNGIATFDGSTYVNGNLYFQSTGGLYMSGTGPLEMESGTFTIKNTAVARFESTVMFLATADVTVIAACDWTFNNWPIFQGGFNAYGTVRFNTEPTFEAGLEIAAATLISYKTAQAFVIRFPFALGMQSPNVTSDYKVDATGFVMQIANTGWPSRLICNPQGFWGGVAVSIAAIEIRVLGHGLSGSPSNPTYFSLRRVDQDWTELQNETVTDSNPNSATAHSASWTGTMAVDPLNEMFMIYFNGYGGGDTLNGSTKWYQINSVRMTLQTNSMGMY